MPENKSKFLVPAVGAAVVAIGGFAAYMYLVKGPSGGSAGALASAKMVPDDALMAAYITTDPQAWSKLEEFGTPEAQKIISDGLKEFNEEALEGDNLSYEEDLKPWVGGVMLAILPPNPVQEAQSTSRVAKADEPNMLMVIGIKDKVAALNFANKLKEQEDVKITETDYKGEKITESKGKGTPTYSAIVNNSSYIVLAPTRSAVEQSIDTLKGEASFLQKPGANDIFNKGAKVDNAIAQVFVPDYAGMVQNLVKSSPNADQIPESTFEQLKQVKSMVAAVGIDNAGVRMKATVNLDPNSNPYQYENSAGNIVKSFPSNTIAMVAGNGLSRWWDAMLTQSKDIPELQTVIGGARTYAKFANIDLDKDVFAWMDGEFGFAAIPSNQGLLAQTGVGGAFVFDTKDRKTTEATLAKLDQLVTAQASGIDISKRKASGKEVTEWKVPQQGALIAHGWLDQDTVFVALGGPIADAMTNNNGQNLTSNESFKSITGSLEKPNSGYFFMDMDQTMTLVNRFAGPTIDPQAKAILGSIRGLGMTATSPDKSTTQLEMLLALKPKNSQ